MPERTLVEVCDELVDSIDVLNRNVERIADCLYYATVIDDIKTGDFSIRIRIVNEDPLMVDVPGLGEDE